MFCPNCGAGEQSADAYCKRCGEWLAGETGIARRALWGEGIKPERRLKTILVRQTLSAAVAVASVIILYANWSDAGRFPGFVKIVALLCLLIAGMQVDGFFIALRMRQDLKRHRADAQRAGELPAHAVPANLDAVETGGFNRAHVEAEETTRRLKALPSGRKRVE